MLEMLKRMEDVDGCPRYGNGLFISLFVEGSTFGQTSERKQEVVLCFCFQHLFSLGHWSKQTNVRTQNIRLTSEPEQSNCSFLRLELTSCFCQAIISVR